jgi:hypothetical protein
MANQIQINFIKSMSGSLYGNISIDPSEYPILNLDLLKKQVRKIVDYDISIFMYNLSIIQTSDDLYPLVSQNTININVIYDNIKKSQRIKRIHDDYIRYMQNGNGYARKEYYMLSDMTLDELEKHCTKIRHSVETLLFDYDGKRFDSIISIYLSSMKKREVKVVNIDLINLNSILCLTIEDIEHYDKLRLSRDDFREYYGQTQT